MTSSTIETNKPLLIIGFFITLPNGHENIYSFRSINEVLDLLQKGQVTDEDIGFVILKIKNNRFNDGEIDTNFSLTENNFDIIVSVLNSYSDQILKTGGALKDLVFPLYYETVEHVYSILKEKNNGVIFNRVEQKLKHNFPDSPILDANSKNYFNSVDEIIPALRDGRLKIDEPLMTTLLTKKVLNKDLRDFFDLIMDPNSALNSDNYILNRKIKNKDLLLQLGYINGSAFIKGIAFDKVIFIRYNYQESPYGFYATVDGKDKKVMLTDINIIHFFTTGEFL